MAAIIPRAEVHGDVLTALMRKHDMTAVSAARRAGVTAAYIRMLANGQRTTTKAVTAQRIAAALGEPVRAFATAAPVQPTRTSNDQGGRKSA